MSYLQNFKYEIHGPEGAEKVVFLHGLMGSGSNWRKIISQLKQDYQILIFDQRGHGLSFKPESGYTAEDYALDLKLILDELGWSQIHLVGHSMGGRNALRFAFKFPQYLLSLVVEDIGPEGNEKSMKNTLGILESVPVPFPDKKAAKKFLDETYPGVLGAYLFTNIEQKPNGQADWRFHKEGVLQSLQSGHQRERWDEVRALDIPTLWIRGERSDHLPKPEFDRILSENPKIQGAQIQGAGHWVHFDRPQEFVAVLKSFLTRRYKGPRT